MSLSDNKCFSFKLKKKRRDISPKCICIKQQNCKICIAETEKMERQLYNYRDFNAPPQQLIEQLDRKALKIQKKSVTPSINKI